MHAPPSHRALARPGPRPFSTLHTTAPSMVSAAHKSLQALYSRSGKLLPSADEWVDSLSRQWHERGDPLPLSSESPRAAPIGLCSI